MKAYSVSGYYYEGTAKYSNHSKEFNIRFNYEGVLNQDKLFELLEEKLNTIQALIRVNYCIEVTGR